MSRGTVILAGILLLAGAAGGDLMLGGGGFGMPDEVIFWKIRVPRVLTALLAGAALSLSGLQMQSLFRNPLADPHIMGVSGGAGLGAALVALALTGSRLPGVSMTLAAFAGAAAAASLIILISRRIQSSYTLLIFGVMLGFIFNAVTSILQYAANEESLKLFYSWMAGSYAGTSYGDVALLGAALAGGAALAVLNCKGLDILLFGDEFASLAGAKVSHVRALAMASCCLMTGAVTAFCGPIGFAGIVAPHLARRALRTSEHRHVLPGAALMGGLVSLAADGLSQAGRLPLPAGSAMALIGIPVILLILLKRP